MFHNEQLIAQLPFVSLFQWVWLLLGSTKVLMPHGLGHFMGIDTHDVRDPGGWGELKGWILNDSHTWSASAWVTCLPAMRKPKLFSGNDHWRRTRYSDTRNLKKMYEDVRALARTLACTGMGKVFARQRAYIELRICHIFCRCSFEIHWVPDLQTGQCPRNDLKRRMLKVGIFPWGYVPGMGALKCQFDHHSHSHEQ